MPFRIPAGIKLVRINRRSGARTSSSDPDSIEEAFKPDTDPPDSVGIFGGTDANGNPTGSPSGNLGSGLGGLW